MDDHLAPLHDADAETCACAMHLAAVAAVGGQGRQLQERRAGSSNRSSRSRAPEACLACSRSGSRAGRRGGAPLWRSASFRTRRVIRHGCARGVWKSAVSRCATMRFMPRLRRRRIASSASRSVVRPWPAAALAPCRRRPRTAWSAAMLSMTSSAALATRDPLASSGVHRDHRARHGCADLGRRPPAVDAPERSSGSTWSSAPSAPPMGTNMRSPSPRPAAVLAAVQRGE